jgi:PKD repeat protein
MAGNTGNNINTMPTRNAGSGDKRMNYRSIFCLLLIAAMVGVVSADATAPVASFTANNETPCSIDTVTFTDTSTNTPTDWDWYFWANETKSSDDQNPTYIFDPGVYNIRLYAANAGGGDWENKTAFINSTDCTPPTPTPTPTPMAGCSYFNLTGVSFGENSTDWNTTEGLTAWGITTSNVTNGNVSWWMCKSTPTPTPTPTITAPWTPDIMPSTEIDTQTWFEWIVSMWWLWLLLVVAFIILVRK